MDKNPNLTAEELLLLTSCQSAEDWDMACTCIKEIRGGAYPPDWYSRVLSNGLMDNIVGRWGAKSALRVEPLTDETMQDIGLRPTDPAPANDEDVCPDCGQVHEHGNNQDETLMLLLLKALIESGRARVIRSNRDPRTMTQEELRELFEGAVGDTADMINKIVGGNGTGKKGGGPVN